MWGVAETGINMMKKFAEEDKPWLLEMHFIEPHDAYTSLRKYRDRYDSSSIPVQKSFYDTFENKPGSVCSRLVQTHDLAHTYIDILGLPKLPFPDARSLVPLFEDPNRSDWRDDILCTFYGGEFIYTQRIVITDRYKYVFNGFDYDEFYDLVEDPEEMNNCVNNPKYEIIVDDMRARLYDLMNQFEDPYGDTQNRISVGNPPNRYGAPRYLPRGKRM